MIADLWPEVRRKHLWPELPMPQMGTIDAPVAMQMRDKQITLNTATCDELAESMPPEAVIEALLDHGVSHYTRCPWDLATHLQLYATAKAELGRKSLARLATDSFIDVVANTACVKEVATPLPDVYRHLGGGPLQGALTALYTQIWGMQLHGSGDPALVRRLARIPYLDRQQWPHSLRRFVQLVRPLLEEEGRGRQPEPPALGHHSLESYSPAEVTLGLQAFAQQAQDIGQFCDVVQDFAKELAALGYGKEAGEGVGPQVDAEALYYMQLAQTYHLPVRGVPMERSGVLEPYSHAPWEASQPVHDIDIWTSFGKLLPGLSQIWKRRQGLVYGQREGTPDCLLGLDFEEAEPGHRLEQRAARRGFTPPRLVLRMGMERDARFHSMREGDLGQLRCQKLGGMPARHGHLSLLHLVVEVDARGAPHHDLARRVALEVLDRAQVDVLGRLRVAAPVLNDAAAVGGAAHGDVVEAEPVEDGGDRADHVRCAEDVAAEVEDDVVVLALARRSGQPPRTLLGHGGQVLGEQHLAVLTRDLAGHVGLRRRQY